MGGYGGGGGIDDFELVDSFEFDDYYDEFEESSDDEYGDDEEEDEEEGSDDSAATFDGSNADDDGFTDDDDDLEEINISLASMELALKPVVLENFERIASTYKKMQKAQDRRQVALQSATAVSKSTERTYERHRKTLIELMETVRLNNTRIEALVDQVIADNPEQSQQFRDGNPKVGGWFVGQVMQASKGKANPGTVNALLKKKLG